MPLKFCIFATFIKATTRTFQVIIRLHMSLLELLRIFPVTNHFNRIDEQALDMVIETCLKPVVDIAVPLNFPVW